MNQPLHYLHKVNNRIHFPIDRSSRCSRVCLIVRDTRLLFLSLSLSLCRAGSFLSLPSDIILKKEEGKKENPSDDELYGQDAEKTKTKNNSLDKYAFSAQNR